VKTEFEDDASSIDYYEAGKQEEREMKRLLGVADGTTVIPDIWRLCAEARSPLSAFHFLLDIEN
jgi:hypothetical protein